MKKHLLLAALLCVLPPLAFAANDTSSNENPSAAPEVTQIQQPASATGATMTLQDEIKKTAVSETARAAVFNSTLDEVVVTTTRIEQPLKQTLSSTTVITQEDIKNSQAADVPTILRSVPGVEISQTGGIGKSSSVFLRGSNSSQTLVLLDGVRISSATLGTTAIEHLMLDQIERIEIVRGNVSSLYGSEAIGGVIQIFTKRGQGDPVFNVSAGAGTHGTQRAAAGFGGKIGNTDFNLQVSRFMTEGVSAINPAMKPAANPDNDGYQNTSVSANIRQAFNTDHSLSVGVFNSLGHNQYDSPSGPSTSSNTNENRLSKLSLTSDNRLSESWQSKILVAKGTDSYQIFTNGATSPGSLYQTDNLQLNWVNQITFSEGKQLLLGVEHLGQKVTSDLNPGYDQTERKVNSLFVGYTGNYGSHQLQTNLRQDNNSQFGTANTGLLGYGYALTDAWRATTSYSTAFRAPTFNDLYWPAYFGIPQSDPNLKPERSNNSEAGLHYAEAERNMDIVYFDNQIKDFITLDSNYFPVNIPQVRITGVELSYSEKFGDTGVKLSATSQNPHNLTTDTTLDRRAKLHSNLLITEKLGSLLLGAEWQYSDSRQDKTNTLDAYNVFNLTAAYVFSKQLKLSIRTDNITDQNNSNAYSYNPLGRTFFASMSFQQ